MSIQRALRRGAQGPEADAEIGAATVRIYKLLWEGEYINAAGQRTIYLHSLPTTPKSTYLLLSHRPGRSSQPSNHVVHPLTQWQSAWSVCCSCRVHFIQKASCTTLRETRAYAVWDVILAPFAFST